MSKPPAPIVRNLNQQATVGDLHGRTDPWTPLTLGDLRRVLEGTEGMGDQAQIHVRVADTKSWIVGASHISGLMINSNVRENGQ